MQWNDLQYFLAVARGRTLAAAGRQLGVDATTVGRRIERLSANLNSDLFEIGPGGHSLTQAGERLLAYAEEMERAALLAGSALSGERTRFAGKVRISLAEGLATWIVGPVLPQLQARHPEIALDMVTGNGFLNPSRREADLAVMLARPTRGPLHVRKLSDYGLGLYGAQKYLHAHGAPHTIQSLRTHRLVGYTPDFIYADELRYLREIDDRLEPSLTSSSINLQHRMIKSGAGLGILPHFIGQQDSTLAPLLPEQIEIRRSFWLVVHDDMRRIARVEAVMEWLGQVLHQAADLLRA